MLHKVEKYNPHRKTRDLIDKANVIINSYQKQGYDLTLRQLYYQFVSRDWLSNNQKSYNTLGKVISKARRGGLVDWNAITDRTRFLRAWNDYEDLSDFIDQNIYQFKLKVWDSQEVQIEVWFEKDALMGIFQKACAKYRIPFFSCRGYVSDSEMYSAARRIENRCTSSQETIILHFGDHDPSGIDMTRDIKDRLSLFGAYSFEVRRMALTYDQILEVKPPPNPAKETDSRFLEYRRKYGEYSWELDALDPSYLVNLVQQEAKSIIDLDKFEQILSKEREERRKLEELRFSDV